MDIGHRQAYSTLQTAMEISESVQPCVRCLPSPHLHPSACGELRESAPLALSKAGGDSQDSTEAVSVKTEVTCPQLLPYPAHRFQHQPSATPAAQHGSLQQRRGEMLLQPPHGSAGLPEGADPAPK